MSAHVRRDCNRDRCNSEEHEIGEALGEEQYVRNVTAIPMHCHLQGQCSHAMLVKYVKEPVTPLNF